MKPSVFILLTILFTACSALPIIAETKKGTGAFLNQFDLTSISTQLLFNTVRISTKNKIGIESVGTASFFSFKVDSNRNVQVLLTNKHVIEGAVSGSFFLRDAETEKDGKVKSSTTSRSITIDQFESQWICHPKSLDICAFPVGQLNQLYKEKFGKNFFSVNFDETLLPSQTQLSELSALETVVMIGYPNGLWDQANNFPLLRRGITSSHPAIDFNGLSQGVVDIAAFPGSSGSPVLIADQGAYGTKNGITLGTRAFLLGILRGGPVQTNTGEIKIIDAPTSKVSVAETKVSIHLGYYIKAKEFLVLKDTIFKKLNVK